MQIYKEQNTVIHITQYYSATIQVMTVTEYVNLQGDRYPVTFSKTILSENFHV